MSFLDRTLNAIGLQRKSLANPSDDLFSIFGAGQVAASGVNVTPAVAMGVPAVRAAVLAISETSGQLPLKVFDRETRERDDTHPVAKVLGGLANEWTTASDLRTQLTQDALLHDDGLAAIVRVDGQPRELVRYLPGTITISSDDYGAPVYKRGNQMLAAADVFHIRAPSIDGIKGDAPIRQAKEAIALAALLERHASKLFASGANVGGVIEVPAGVGETAYAKILRAFKAAHEGVENTGKTALLVDGAKWSKVALSSVDAQFLEMRNFAITEIARVFRVPPVLLMDYGRATWSNSADMGQQFLSYCLLPWLKRWEGQVMLKLFDETERATVYAEHVVDGLLRADFSARMSGYSTAIASRILSPNEARAAENRPPYDGGDAFENPNITTSPAKPANDNTSKEAAAS